MSDDNITATLVVLDGLNDEIRRAEDAAAARETGGQHVPFHGDFANATPSVLGRLWWWSRALRTALVAEVQRRPEQAAGREHVERVVREEIRDADWRESSSTIARRVADRLCVPAPTLSDPPIPDGWPGVFNLEQAEACIEVTLEEHGNAPGICELVVELRWAIAQLRADRIAAAPTAPPDLAAAARAYVDALDAAEPPHAPATADLTPEERKRFHVAGCETGAAPCSAARLLPTVANATGSLSLLRRPILRRRRSRYKKRRST